MKSYEETMEILEAFALTNSFRAAAALAGCSHHTVEHWVTMRDLGLLPDGTTPVVRVKLIDGFMPKIEEWVERSSGRTVGCVAMWCSTSSLCSGSPGRTARSAGPWLV